MKYIIKVWIPIEGGYCAVFASREDAEKEMEQLGELNPDNHYMIEEVGDDKAEEK